MRELRNVEAVRDWLAAGAWLQRLLAPTDARAAACLPWALELASNAVPLPPLGLIADLGQLVLGYDHGLQRQPIPSTLTHWPATLVRQYEDQVFGRWWNDSLCQRAAQAVARYPEKDQTRALAYLLQQVFARWKLPGTQINPAALRSLIKHGYPALLNHGAARWEHPATSAEFQPWYEQLVVLARDQDSPLTAADVFELEHGTALWPFSQRLALRQIIQVAEHLNGQLPTRWTGPRRRGSEVPTQALEEDSYPIGGYSSLSNHGSLESLLHSQLAFMEGSERPDLFDIKFVRDELLYYARDENQFLRTRHTIFLILDPDLQAARYKTPELPAQQMIFLLGLLQTLVRRLTEILSEDALQFEILFLETTDSFPLEAERNLLEVVWREPIRQQLVTLQTMPLGKVLPHLRARAARSLCRAVQISFHNPPRPLAEIASCGLQLGSGLPTIVTEDHTWTPAGSAESAWSGVLWELLGWLAHGGWEHHANV